MSGRVFIDGDDIVTAEGAAGAILRKVVVTYRAARAVRIDGAARERAPAAREYTQLDEEAMDLLAR
jgi:hypothetical protein